jgi:hypothetical protein
MRIQYSIGCYTHPLSKTPADHTLSSHSLQGLQGHPSGRVLAQHADVGPDVCRVRNGPPVRLLPRRTLRYLQRLQLHGADERADDGRGRRLLDLLLGRQRRELRLWHRLHQVAQHGRVRLRELGRHLCRGQLQLHLDHECRVSCPGQPAGLMKRAGMNWSFLDEMESKPATFMSFSRQFKCIYSIFRYLTWV